MEWQDRAVVLQVRPHGEHSAIVELLSLDHGLHAGLVRGAASKRLRGLLQPGNVVQAHWRARLSEHLGSFVLEPVEARASAFFDNAMALDGLAATCAMASLCLPERESFPRIYAAFDVLTANMDDDTLWPALYVRWEAGLLLELGYGLRLDRCAVSGSTENLSYVSPRSGRAVCTKEAQPWLKQLLPLPGFLTDNALPVQTGDIGNGLALTGHFLERRLLWPANKVLPKARERMIGRMGDAGLS